MDTFETEEKEEEKREVKREGEGEEGGGGMRMRRLNRRKTCRVGESRGTWKPGSQEILRSHRKF